MGDKMKRIWIIAIVSAFAIVFLSILVWAIITPEWSFTVTTGKSTYMLGEDVTITATLRNEGFIPHSFKSWTSEPILISIEYQPGENPTVTYRVWYYINVTEDITEFSISPNESLERTFVWNQTNISSPWFWNQTYMPGTYHIKVFIPEAQKNALVMENYLFTAHIKITVTSD